MAAVITAVVTAVADTVINMKNKIKYFLLPKRLRKKWSYEDYLYYRFQNKSIKEIEYFLTVDELWETEARLNADNSRPIFNSKALFYKTFKSFIKRNYLLFENASEEEIGDFRAAYPKCVLKPDDMYAGIGIYIVDSNEPLPLSFDELKAKKYIIEEYVTQHEKYSNIYPGSLNTIRITTFISESGNPEILFAANQFGSHGSMVDNDDSTAIWGICDNITGIIEYADIDAASGLIYDSHPDTGQSIVGFHNHNWNEVVETAIKASLVVPDCRLVGWDVAVRNDGEIVIIEGNVTPELDLYQRISGMGLSRISQKRELS